MQFQNGSNFPNDQNLLQYSYKQESLKGSNVQNEQNTFQDIDQRPQNLGSNKNFQISNQENEYKGSLITNSQIQFLQQQQEQFLQQKNKLKSKYEEIVQAQEKENDELKKYEQKYQDALDIQRELERQLQSKKLQLSMLRKSNQNDQEEIIGNLKQNLKNLNEEKMNLLNQISTHKNIYETIHTEITNIHTENNSSKINSNIYQDIQVAKNKIKQLEEQIVQQNDKNNQEEQSNFKNETLDHMEQRLNQIDQNLNFLKNKKNCYCKEKDQTVQHLQDTLKQLERPIQTVVYEQKFDTYHDCMNSLNYLPSSKYYYHNRVYSRSPSPVYTVTNSHYQPQHYQKYDLYDNQYNKKAFEDKQYYSSMTGACQNHDWFQQSRETSLSRQPSIKSENLYEFNQHQSTHINDYPQRTRYITEPRVRRVSRSRSRSQSYRNVQEPELVHERRRISQIRTSSPVQDRNSPFGTSNTVRTVVTNFMENQDENRIQNNSYNDFQISDSQNQFNNSMTNPNSQHNNKYKFESFGKVNRNFNINKFNN